jgi:hypothetical protein
VGVEDVGRPHLEEAANAAAPLGHGGLCLNKRACLKKRAFASKRRPGRVREKVKMDQSRYWFRRTRFGWGLEPGSREGWIATVLFVIIAVGGVAALMPIVVTSRSWILVAWAIAWSVAFTALVVAKGEKLW